MTAVDRPIVSRALFGRSGELAALDAALAQMRSGRGQVILIAGEAGIGKTRLVAEARSHALAAGSAVLEGHCFEADRIVPFAAFVDLIRGFAHGRTPQELVELAGAGGGALLTLAPDLAERLPGLRPPLPLEPEQEKRRIFRAIVDLTTHIASREPLVMAIEDVHWSDDSSLELLSEISRMTSTQRILLLLSYRSDEIAPTLRRLLADLDRGRLAIELRPARLAFEEAGAMLQGLFELRRPVPDAFLAMIHSLTEGNPFFIEEITRSLLAAGAVATSEGGFVWTGPGEIRVPRTVEEAVRRRSDNVSTRAREVLGIAAVAGRRFEPTLLREITGGTEQEIVAVLRELMDASLVVEESADRFAFRHALTREAVYSALLARERRAVHRTIAETLERVHALALEARSAELAYHFHEAGIWEKTIEYGTRAGERARALYAPRSAVEQFDRVLHAGAELGTPPDASWLRSRGLAHETLGDFDRARADLEAAGERARASGSRPMEWQILLDLGLLWASTDYGKAGELLDRALGLAREIGDPRLVGHSLDRIGNWFVNVGRTQEGLAAHEEALVMFRAIDDKEGVAATLDLLGMARGIHGDVAAAVGEYRAAIELLRTLDDSDALVSSLASHALWSGPALAETVPSGRATPDDHAKGATEAIALARRSGSRAGEAYSEWSAGLGRAGFGDFTEALAHAQRGLRVASDIGHQQWIAASHFAIGHASVLMLDLSTAAYHLEESLRLARALGSAWWTDNSAASLAMAHLYLGDNMAADVVVRGALPADREAGTLAGRRLALVRSELALASGQPERALVEVDRLVATASPDGDHPIPALERTRAVALTALGRHADALAALADAERGALERHDRPVLWRVLLARAKVLASAGEAGPAREVYRAARAVVEELAGSIQDMRLRDRFLRAATASMPKTANRGRAPSGPEVLTAREHEVAQLVAEGLSNRAIASKLFVGERTVEAHVSSILAKLGHTSRARIAAWATADRLAQERR